MVIMSDCPIIITILFILAHNDKLTQSMQDLLQKIPEGAESLTVLVGGVSFLQEPLVVFLRLKQSHLLGDLTEVPIPVRFIYLALGPHHLMDYHEVGRAMATLMSDKVCFHNYNYFYCFGSNFIMWPTHHQPKQNY